MDYAKPPTFPVAIKSNIYEHLEAGHAFHAVASCSCGGMKPCIAMISDRIQKISLLYPVSKTEV